MFMSIRFNVVRALVRLRNSSRRLWRINSFRHPTTQDISSYMENLVPDRGREEIFMELSLDKLTFTTTGHSSRIAWNNDLLLPTQ